MERALLEQMALARLSTREMARRAGTSQTNVRYWLRKYAIAIPKQKPTTCPLCGRTLLDNRRRHRCSSCNTRIRRMRTKLAAIKLLGGKCNRCDFKGPPAAFDFHHRDGTKDFSIGQVANKSWEVIKRELAKCELLCRNCHAIEHSKHLDPLLLAEVENYRGRLLQ